MNMYSHKYKSFLFGALIVNTPMTWKLQQDGVVWHVARENNFFLEETYQELKE